MKKSSLGRKSAVAAGSRKTSDFFERNSGIPVFTRSSSSCALNSAQTIPRKRDLSADRVSTSRRRDPSSDRMSEFTTPCRSNTLRTPRQLTMSSGRPSSISSKKGDTRPLTDKEWQKQALDTVLCALNLNQEGYNIIQNYKSLKPMSLVMFVDVCNFLLGQLDNKVVLTKINILTEFPFLLKKLKYKGKMDKMMLQTVNTPHNWPNVLGILHFLAELVIAAEQFKANSFDCMYPDSLDGDNAEPDELNFKYIVPLLNNLWSVVGKKEELEIDQLLKNNMDLVNHALNASGFSSEVYQQEAENKIQYEEARKKHDEALETFYNIELKHKAANDKLEKICKKNEVVRKEISDLQIDQQNKISSIAEIDNEIRYMENEIKILHGLLDQYEDDNMTPVEYEKFEANKQNMLEEIKLNENGVIILEEALLDNKVITQTLKTEQMKLIKEFNSNICKLMEEDISFKNVLCHSKPNTEDAPLDQATENLLEEAVKLCKEKLEAAQKKLEESTKDTSRLINQSEELESQQARLLELKSMNINVASQNEKKILELQSKLTELTKEEAELDKEILASQEVIEKNHEEYSRLETEFSKKDSRMKKFSEICQKKLDIRYRTIVELDVKMQALEDKLKDAFQKCSLSSNN